MQPDLNVQCLVVVLILLMGMRRFSGVIGLLIACIRILWNVIFRHLFKSGRRSPEKLNGRRVRSPMLHRP